jgi:hypothetical protein
MTRRILLLFPLALPLLVGCGSGKTAPVSGRVTLNGKPLVNASVTFAPVGEKGSQEPGPSSAGKTDADGRYTLELIGGQGGSGAVVGKHKVRIALQGELPTSEDRPETLKQLPLKYNGQTTLEFDVPAKGTDAADFDLKVP